MIVRHGECAAIVPQHGIEHFTDWHRGSVDSAFGDFNPVLDPVPGIAHKYKDAFAPRIRKHHMTRRCYIGSVAKFRSAIDRLDSTLCQRERCDESRRLGHTNA